MAMTTNIFTK